MDKNIDKKEIWITIKGFDKYQVSNKGNVRSVNYYRKGFSKNLKLFPNSKGYLQVWLCLNGKKHTRDVHRLVAEHFIENPNNLPQVNHINEINSDNRAENLEWCTNQYNNEYSHGVKILQFDLNGNLVNDYKSYADIKRKTGFSKDGIKACCDKRRDSFVGYKWKYKTDLLCQD